eukprot:4036421-Heterocapsa_arctica.AAC.1
MNNQTALPQLSSGRNEPPLQTQLRIMICYTLRGVWDVWVVISIPCPRSRTLSRVIMRYLLGRPGRGSCYYYY